MLSHPLPHQPLGVSRLGRAFSGPGPARKEMLIVRRTTDPYPLLVLTECFRSGSNSVQKNEPTWSACVPSVGVGKHLATFFSRQEDVRH